MKIRLLTFTSLDSFPVDGLLAKLPSFTQTRGGSSGFTNCDDNMSFSSKEKFSFIKTDTLFPFSCDLQYSSKTDSKDDINFLHVSSLNV
jgi:hypothetical protein